MKVVFIMDDSTLEAMETEESNEALERYRFIFIRYLEVLTDLLTLGDNYEHVERIDRILNDGWNRSGAEIIGLQEKAAIDAEKFLYDRYDLEYSLEGLRTAVRQFYADLVVTMDREFELKSALIDLVYDIDFTDEDTEEVWFADDIEGQFDLLKGELARDRILHYKKELLKMGQKPMSPNLLETTFRFRRNGLMYLTPFSL